MKRMPAFAVSSRSTNPGRAASARAGGPMIQAHREQKRCEKGQRHDGAPNVRRGPVRHVSEYSLRAFRARLLGALFYRRGRRGRGGLQLQELFPKAFAV